MIAFVFPGQGAQYVGMGQSIAARYPAAADLFARAGMVLGFDLLALCAAGPEERLRATENTQPAVLVTGLACAAALAAHGVRPDAVAGLSLGEYAALVSAGVMGFEDAVQLVRQRGLFMQEATAGREVAMAAVIGLEAEKVERLCAEQRHLGVVEPANYNGAGQIVVGGDAAGRGPGARGAGRRRPAGHLQRHRRTGAAGRGDPPPARAPGGRAGSLGVIGAAHDGDGRVGLYRSRSWDEPVRADQEDRAGDGAARGRRPHPRADAAEPGRAGTVLVGRLDGRVALVTGASGGLGRAIALGLAAEGAAVAVHYAANRAQAEAVVGTIAGRGGAAVALQGDLTDPGVPGKLVDETQAQLGGLHILVNNAGVVRDTLI